MRGRSQDISPDSFAVLNKEKVLTQVLFADVRTLQQTGLSTGATVASVAIGVGAVALGRFLYLVTGG